MKRKTWIFIAVYILIGIVFVGLTINHTARYSTRLTGREITLLRGIGELKMAGDNGYPPLSFTDIPGEKSGYEADLIKALEKELGIKIQLVQMTWAEAMEALDSGEICGITGMRVTDDRSGKYYFTKPYWQTTYSIVGDKGTNFQSLLEKKGVKVAVQKGSSTYNFFREKYSQDGIIYEFVKKPFEGMELFEKGEVDVWVENYLVARYFALQKGVVDALEFYSIPDSIGDYSIVFSKEYSNLVPIFNKVLLKLQTDGVLSDFDQKWFGIVNKRYLNVHWYFIILSMIFLIMTVIFVSLMWTSLVKRKSKVELKKKEDFALSIINNLSESIAVLDIDGQVIATNHLWQESVHNSSGLCAFCSEGNNYLQVCEKALHRDRSKQGEIVEGIQEVISGQQKEFALEYPHESAEGIHWLYMRVTPMSDQVPSQVIVAIMDITSSKLAAEALRENEEKYRATFENTGTAMIIINEDTSISLANHQCELLCGFTKEELIGSSWTKLVHHEELERMLDNHYNRRRQEGASPRQYEFRLKKKNGQLISIFITVNMLPGTIQSIASLIDITQIKSMEKNLLESKIKIEKLHEIAFKMERCQSEDEVYHLIIDAAEGILNFSFCTVDSVDGDFFITRATSSQVANQSMQKLPISGGLAGKTYRTGKTYRVDNIWEHKDAKPVCSDYRSAISAPIGDIGIFQVVSNKIGAFNQEDVEMTELLLSHATEAIKRIRSEEKIRYMSFHDSLTGLYNRAFFDEELNRLDTMRQLPLSVIIGDINGLKLVNDVFGHQKGDEYIVQIAEIIKNSFRKEDIITRWGGDEFSILLPKTEEKVATEICGRVRNYCAQVNSDSIKPSIALGVASKESIEQNIHEVMKEAENRMYRNKLAESRSARSAIITSLEKTLWEKSYETEEHARRLQGLVSFIEKPLNLSASQMDDLSLLTSLHDIGKIAVPESIIKKSAALTEDEWEIVRRHPEIGYRIAQSSPELGPIADAILTHHEWWDGNGYPEGLKGEEIPLISRILAIADAFEVMTHGRPYKAPKTDKEALEELQRCAGSQFDPRLVEIFVREYLAQHNVLSD